MEYRKEIDGLRAVAVLPVILFHAHFPFFKGGYLGVDIFFVISGYLITSILYYEMMEQKFSITKFYERRARRILPALVFITSLSILPAWLWMLPNDFKDFSQSLAAVYLFSSNFLFWQEAGYFSPATELKPLLHTWSLAVEEQYYVLFPLLMLLLCRLGKKAVLLGIFILSVVSLLFANWLSGVDNEANFYLLPSRAWELGAGGLVAITYPALKLVNIKWANALSLAGLITIIACILSFSELNSVPGTDALLPIFATVLIIAFGRSGTIAAKILSIRPMVTIGLISYSAYLWHQPLFAFARIRSIDTPSLSLFSGLSILTLILAYATWKYVENPFRSKQRFNRAQIFTSAAVFSLLFVSFGALSHIKNGFPERLPLKALQLLSENAATPSRRHLCSASPGNFIPPPSEACIYNKENLTTVALWGDSHSGAVADALADKLSSKNIGMLQLTFSGCPSALDFRRSDISSGECKRFNHETLEYLISSDIKTVILVSRWSLHLLGERFNNGEGGIEQGKRVFGITEGMDANEFLHPDRVKNVAESYKNIVRRLLNASKKVVLVYPIPEVGWHVPSTLLKKALYNSNSEMNINTSLQTYRNRHKEIISAFNSIGTHPKLTRVHPSNVFCSEKSLPERCIAAHEGNAFYYDNNHLNFHGASLLTEVLVDTL